MVVKRKKVRLDSYEGDLILKSLNQVRTEMINKNECDRDVSELMLKIMKAPSRKVRRRNEAR